MHLPAVVLIPPNVRHPGRYIDDTLRPYSEARRDDGTYDYYVVGGRFNDFFAASPDVDTGVLTITAAPAVPVTDVDVESWLAMVSFDEALPWAVVDIDGTWHETDWRAQWSDDDRVREDAERIWAAQVITLAQRAPAGSRCVVVDCHR